MATTDIAIISNNIANSGSTGFKRSDGNFLDSYAEDIPIPGLNVGFGVVHEEPRRQDTKQGALRVTNNSLDLAVSGDGLFVTKHPQDNEVTFTRDGSFMLDINGNLTTVDKKPVVNTNGDPIVIPPMLQDEQGRNMLFDVINISHDGAMLTYGDGRIFDIGKRVWPVLSMSPARRRLVAAILRKPKNPDWPSLAGPWNGVSVK